MNLTDAQIDGLFDTVIPAGPHKGKKWGSVYGRIFNGRDALKQTMSLRADQRIQRDIREQTRKSEAFRANILKDRANGIWNKPEDLMRLAEEQNINLTQNLKSTILKEPISDETARLEADRLISDRGGDDGGFLTRAEYDLLPPSVRDEYKDNLIDAPEAAENKKKTELIQSQLKGFVIRATRSKEGPDGKLTDPDADLIYNNATEHYSNRFLELRRENPGWTAGQAFTAVRQEMEKEFDTAAYEPKDSQFYKYFDASLSENIKVEQATDQLSDNPLAISARLPGFGTVDDPETSLGRLAEWNAAGGLGNNAGKFIPNEYYRVARLLPDMDVFNVF